ncbi:MAG: hypothetical protein VX642_07785 [Bdellovibrionota bacterium]|nr:hypothetical protein [Bdellovibrionota bacterium]
MIKNFIFIEDDEEDYWLFERCLKELNLPLSSIRLASLPEVKDRIVEFSPNTSIVFVDLNLGGQNGLKIFKEYLEPQGFLSCVLSSSDNPKEIKDCLAGGFWFYASKEINVDRQKLFFQSIFNLFSLGKVGPSDLMSFRKNSQDSI